MMMKFINTTILVRLVKFCAEVETGSVLHKAVLFAIPDNQLLLFKLDLIIFSRNIVDEKV